MKIHCHRPSLATAFQIVQAVIPARTPKDILKNVKLQVTDGKAILIGTDQEVGIRYEIPGVEADTSGETILPTNRMVSILRELTSDSVEMEIANDRIKITSGQSEFQLAAEDPAEFPPVPAFDAEAYYVLPAKSLKEAIRRTVFATDVESTRYALGGVLMEIEGSSVALAATDSRRLALAKTTCRTEGDIGEHHARPVIPSKAMSLIEKSIAEEDENVSLCIHTNDILVKCGRSTIYARLVEGRFPNYRDVVPKESRTEIEFVAGPFYSAVRQAQIVTSEESRGVDFVFHDGKLTLSSKAADVGQSTIEMPISYDKDKICITFDPRFVADFLRILDSETHLTLFLNDAESAAVLRTDDSYTYVIMPLSQDS